MNPQFTLDYNKRTIRATTLITATDVKSHPRSSIRHITPFGYTAIKDDNIYVVHRTHLIADQLLPEGLSAVSPNIISGTFYLNIKLMLPLENQIKRFIMTHNISVFYSVEPMYYDGCYIPHALHIKAISLEKEPSLNIDVVLPNSQPGYCIDYQSGKFNKIK